jgi:hypothetical protein
MWFSTQQVTTDHIFCILQILEKKWEYIKAEYQLFIDFKKACYSVRREVLYSILIEFGIFMELVDVPACCVMPPLETLPPQRSEWGSNLPPDCFVSRGNISHMYFVTKVFLWRGVVSTSPNPPSWRTPPWRLSATAYSIYSQLPA